MNNFTDRFNRSNDFEIISRNIRYMDNRYKIMVNRSNLPSIFLYHGQIQWFNLMAQCHNDDGPAVTGFIFEPLYFINGKQITKFEHYIK